MTRPWTRGAITLAVTTALAAAFLASPVTAGSGSASKKFVRSLVKRNVSQLRGEIRDNQTTAITKSFSGPFALNGVNVEVVLTTMNLPEAGSYLIFAKLWWRPTSSTSTGAGAEIDCDLLAGSDFDSSRGSGVGDFDFGTLALQLAHRAQGPTSVAVRCRDEFSGGNSVEVHNFHLAAVKVAGLDFAPPREQPVGGDLEPTRP